MLFLATTNTAQIVLLSLNFLRYRKIQPTVNATKYTPRYHVPATIS